MSAKINIQIQEKKWSKVDLRKLSKKAFKSTFKILSYPQLFKFLEVSILACNDKKIKEYNKKFREKAANSCATLGGPLQKVSHPEAFPCGEGPSEAGQA